MITISFRIEEDQVESLKYYARLESGYNKEEISYIDLIRNVISEKYPVLDKSIIDKEVLHCSGLIYNKVNNES